MNAASLLALSPMLVLSAGCVAVMLSIAVRRSNLQTASITALSMVLSLAALVPVAMRPTMRVPPLFLLDGYFVFACALVLLSALAVLLLSVGYIGALQPGLKHVAGDPPELAGSGHIAPVDEYYLLLLIATLGAVVMLASDHFVTFFLGLETLSVALLGLIAYPRHRLDATEAAMKYLVLAGTSSAFLLFGIALIYAVNGSLSFVPAAPGPVAIAHASLYRLAALAFVLTGIGYKLSLVPFHMWAPDVYEGAPAPSAAFVAVVSKLSVFTVLVRYFVSQPGNADPTALTAIAIFAVLSMIVGNLLALGQDNLKRLLAYSSIAHLGYLLVAFLSPHGFGIEASSFYLAAYAVTTLGAFGVITVLSNPRDIRDAGDLASYRGLFWRRPWLAGILTMMLMSLAGIPPTMGFIAKTYVMVAGVGAGLTIPLAALVLGSVIGLYYYLRVIVVMVMPVQESAPLLPVSSGGGLAGSMTLAALAVVLLLLGLAPATLIPAIRRAAPEVTASAMRTATSAEKDARVQSMRAYAR